MGWTPRTLIAATMATLAIWPTPRASAGDPIDLASPQSASIPPGRAAFPKAMPGTGASSAAGAVPSAGAAASMAAQTPQAPIPESAIPTTPEAAGAAPGEAPTTPGAFPSTPGEIPSTPSPALSSGLGETVGGTGSYFPNVIGDQAPFFQLHLINALQAGRPPQIPSPPPIPPPGVPPVPPRPGEPGRLGAALFPSIRGFKIAENQSPRPTDRFYFSFNFYDAVNTSLNQRIGSPLSNMKAYREVFGVEKTFLDKRASIGLRLPLNQLTAASPYQNLGFGGTNSALGDLAVILKYAFYDNRDTGNLLSGGLLINAPSGPSSFASAPYIRSFHSTTLQPYVGYIFTRGDFFLQGFSSLDVPTDSRDVTMLYNDVSMGYFVYRSPDPNRFITAFVPSFETHVNTPLNHRDYLNVFDPAGTPDVVDLTFGANVFVRQRGLLTVGLVEPITGPRPFNYEFLIQFNLRF